MAGIDVISNTTGQEMTSALNQILETSKELTTASKLIAAAQSVQARENLKSVTWTELARFANDGLITSVLDYGDMVNDTWVDKSVDPTVEYSNPFQLAHIEDVELADGEILKNRPFFQTHYTQLQSVRYSGRRAFWAVTTALAAGDYCIEVPAIGKMTETLWTFTLAKTAPVGSRLVGFEDARDVVHTSHTITVYASDGKTVLETTTATAGSTGTKLGTCPYSSTDISTDANAIENVIFGDNAWSKSALRQYLNSSAGTGGWWTPQDKWDVAPTQLETIPGWLSGCSEDFINNLKAVKVTTALVNGTETTYDRVFIQSLEQNYAAPASSGEGTAFEYWKRRIGMASPLPRNTANSAAKVYGLADHNSSKECRTRSIYPTNGSEMYTVNADGKFRSALGYSAYARVACTPVVVF